MSGVRDTTIELFRQCCIFSFILYLAGGSFCNIMAIHLARTRHNPALKQKGLFGSQPLIVMTSDEAHYSIAKGANFLGFGSDSVVKVKTDERGIVIPQDLENKIQQCKQNVSIYLLMLTRPG